jgi:folate-binding protein YgfZ
MNEYRSPLLDQPKAVAASGLDAGIAWHYGDPLREQRAAAETVALYDRSHRDVLVVPGPDRLEWLHAICSQHVSQLADGDATQALVLSMTGHVEQHWQLTELAGQVWIDVEAGAADEALAYLLKMRFLKRVEPAIVTSEYALLALAGPRAGDVLAMVGVANEPRIAVALPAGGFVRPSVDGFELLVPRESLADWSARLIAAGAAPAGSWAAAALRVERHQPRLGLDTDHRTLSHEAGWVGSAVHLDKGCYRGQETVARVQNMGKAPRRLVLLHLSGDSELLPEPGSPVEKDGRTVGFVGTAVQHWELGPIALAIVKRGTGLADQLTVAGHTAALDPADAVAEAPAGFAGTLTR